MVRQAHHGVGSPGQRITCASARRRGLASAPPLSIDAVMQDASPRHDDEAPLARAAHHPARAGAGRARLRVPPGPRAGGIEPAARPRSRPSQSLAGRLAAGGDEIQPGPLPARARRPAHRRATDRRQPPARRLRVDQRRAHEPGRRRARRFRQADLRGRHRARALARARPAAGGAGDHGPARDRGAELRHLLVPRTSSAPQFWKSRRSEHATANARRHRRLHAGQRAQISVRGQWRGDGVEARFLAPPTTAPAATSGSCSGPTTTPSTTTTSTSTAASAGSAGEARASPSPRLFTGRGSG